MEMLKSVPRNEKVSQITLCYKSKICLADAPIINSSSSAYKLFLNHWNLDTIELREEFKIILLNRKLKAMGIIDIASGGLNAAAVDVRLIFAAALKGRANAIILAHNHPSLGTSPSNSDLALTREIVNGGKLLKISIFDHLIITPCSFYSMADNGDLYF